MKISDWFIQNAGTKPARHVIGCKNKIGRRDSNPHLIDIGIIHKQSIDESVRAFDCNRRCIGSLIAKPSSHLNGLDVQRIVRAGKQWRKIEKLVGRRIGFEKVCMVCGNDVSPHFPRVSNPVDSAASDAAVSGRGGTRSSKNLKRLVVGVVLGWIDVNEQLRVRYPPPVVANNPVRASQKKPRAVRFVIRALNPIMSESFFAHFSSDGKHLFAEILRSHDGKRLLAEIFSLINLCRWL